MTAIATTPPPTFGPGFHPNLSFEQYAAIPAVSRTLLAKISDTPADAKMFMEGEGETSEALEFGIGAHCLMLEPERFDDQFAIGPDVKLNTTEGKNRWGAFVSKNIGKRFIRGAAGDLLLGMRSTLFAHPLARKLLTATGVNEVVCVWRDQPSGLMCKIRLDRHIEWGGGTAIIDYKTTTDASKSEFPKSYGKYKYYLQQAFYTDGVAGAINERPQHFFFIAQEKTPPFKVNVFEFPSYREEQGRRMYRDLLDLYQLCQKNNSWPAWDLNEYSVDVIESDVPRFAMKDAEIPLV